MPDVSPRVGESQHDFAIRFHKAVGEAIPDTVERNAAMFESWDAAHPEGDELGRMSAQHWPTDKYTRVPNVAVFAEHTTKNRDGSVSKYDLTALRSIANRCNARIADTGNYSPITEGHTPESSSQPQPAVLGYSGPFKLGMIGRQKPRWAIFADEHWLKEHAGKMRSLPNRSPEVWLEPNIEDRFFDPIAALGATTPRLDLGMVRYGRRGEALVEKYSAMSIGAFSGGLPEPVRYGADADDQSGDSSMNDDDVSRIVDAIMSSDVFQWAAQKMAQESASSRSTNSGAGAPGSGAPGAGTANGEHSRPAPAPSMSAPSGQGFPPNGGAGAGNGQPPDLDPDEKELYGCLPPEAQQKFMAYRSRVRGSGASGSAGQHSATPRGMYSADGDTDETETVPGTAADDAANPPSEPSATAPDPDPQAQESDMADTELKEKYELLQRDHEDTKRRLAEIESERVRVDRYSKLSTLKERGGFLFDVTKEVEKCKAMTAEQFEEHRKGIVENYSRIPTAGAVPELFVEHNIEQTNANQFSESDRDAVVKYCRQHGCDWETGVAEYRKQKAPVVTGKVA